MELTKRKLKKELILVAGVLTAISGLLHLLPAAYTHWSVFPPLETLFFITLGLAQIIWAYKFIKHPNERGYQLGLVLNGGTAFFWILTRTLPAPFQAGSEHVDLLSAAIFVLQLGAVISLLFWEEITDRKHLIRNTLFAIIVMLVIGSGLYGATNAMEWVFPQRTFSHAHAEEEDHGYTEEDSHGHEEGAADSHESEPENSQETDMDEMIELKEEESAPPTPKMENEPQDEDSHNDDHVDDGHGH